MRKKNSKKLKFRIRGKNNSRPQKAINMLAKTEKTTILFIVIMVSFE
jgi:hypothetical protein